MTKARDIETKLDRLISDDRTIAINVQVGLRAVYRLLDDPSLPVTSEELKDGIKLYLESRRHRLD